MKTQDLQEISEIRQEVDMQKLYNEKEKALMEREKSLEKGWKVLTEEKEKLENLKISNKERLNNENLIAQEFIQKELESLRLKKASFEASMERERLLFSEKTRTERNQMVRDVEREMQMKLEKMEHDHSKQYLEEQKLELQKEIDKLNTLVKKMKDQSEGVTVVLEKHIKCKKCGDDINIVISKLQLLQDVPEASDMAVEVSEKVAEIPEVTDMVPEASLCSELKTVPGKRVIKPKRGTRANPVKKVSEVLVNEDCSMDDNAVEVLEASLHSESKNLPGKRGGAKPNRVTKPKRRGAQVNSVKEDSEEVKVLSERTLDPPTEIPASTNKGVVDKEEPVGITLEGKRVRSHAIINDQQQDSSVMRSGNKKRRQTVTQEAEVAAGRRYGLRQRKT